MAPGAWSPPLPGAGRAQLPCSYCPRTGCPVAERRDMGSPGLWGLLAPASLLPRPHPSLYIQGGVGEGGVDTSSGSVSLI